MWLLLDKEGPIHDLAWRPGAAEFLVIHGFMPAHVSAFNVRGELVHSFGAAPRNTIRFNGQGNLLMLAGFGNLAGNVEIWALSGNGSVAPNVATKKTSGKAGASFAALQLAQGVTQTQSLVVRRVAAFQASGTTSCEWSPMGRHLLLATLAPRLRVDNGWKIVDYHGTLVASGSYKELLQAEWGGFDIRAGGSTAARDFVPCSNLALTSGSGSVAFGVGSNGAQGGASVNGGAGLGTCAGSRGAYVPPSKRGQATTGGSLPVGLDQPSSARKMTSYYDPSTPSRVYSSPFDRPKGDSKVNPTTTATATTSSSHGSSSMKPLTQQEKLVKTITQKLDQIKLLKEKQAAGLSLELNQLEKISKEVDLLKQLNQLFSSTSSSTTAG